MSVHASAQNGNGLVYCRRGLAPERPRGGTVLSDVNEQQGLDAFSKGYLAVLVAIAVQAGPWWLSGHGIYVQ